MFTMNQLMLDIVKSARIYFESDSIEIDFNNIYGNLNRIKTLYEMRDFFKLYCKSVIEKIEKKRSNRTNDMIKDTISYISSHYHEYDISTELLANMANLTPGYFGKLFAEYTGKTVNEHIMSLRFSKAKELLTTTSLTINDISEKVGFINQHILSLYLRRALVFHQINFAVKIYQGYESGHQRYRRCPFYFISQSSNQEYPCKALRMGTGSLFQDSS